MPTPSPSRPVSVPAPDETLSLGDFLPFRLSVLTNTISRRIAERYDREFGLSIWQWRVMAVLGETPGLSASEVADRTAMDKVAVSRAVAGLMEMGHVRRSTAEEDGRRSRLQLSAKGLAVYRRIVPMARAYAQELEGAISQDDLKRLHRLLDRFAEVVSPDRPLW
jgi:DNA-binding MarR family transcriptional regulator